MKSVTVFLLAAFLSVATTMVNVACNNHQAGTVYAQEEPDGNNNQEGTDEADGNNNNLDCGDLDQDDCVL